MLLDGYKFSDNQTLTNLDSTGEVSTETFDLEEIHSSTMVDDQVVGGVVVTIREAPAQATIAGTEGLMFEVRTAALEALAAGYEVIGAISVLPARIVAGAQFFIPMHCDIAQKELGLWYKAINTAFVGDIKLDADYHAFPVTKNEALQKAHS